MMDKPTIGRIVLGPRHHGDVLDHSRVAPKPQTVSVVRPQVAEQLQARLRSAEAALRELVNAIEVVLDHPSYKSVITVAHVHGVNYVGPTIEKQLEAARGHLARHIKEEPVAG